MSEFDILIIGAGPAGLTAGLEAVRKGLSVCVLESNTSVGGISRTEIRDGWRFDLGGHRFFSKVLRVNDFWESVLSSEDFLLRPRLSRIYYRDRFFEYPLKPLNAFLNLGIHESARCIISYLAARIRGNKDDNFEEWVSSRFGRRLYKIFFKTYTEKVWGVPASTLPSDWAVQRIKNLSLGKAILNSFGLRSFSRMKKNSDVITTLIDEFYYPRLGPGMLWERVAELINKDNNSIVRLNSNVSKLERTDDVWKVSVEGTSRTSVTSRYVISTVPISILPKMLQCEDVEVLASAKALNHRDFLTVGVVVKGENLFPDNWIYIHSDKVKVGRIQNFRSWSPEMCKPGYTLLGLEYFVNATEDFWNLPDDQLVRQAKLELITLGLVDKGDMFEGYVVRVPKAYPIYTPTYKKEVEVIKNYIEKYFSRLWTVGRNGMHRYNNQDHSMLTAMLAIDQISEGKRDLDAIWKVNTEQEYLEDNNHGGRSAPVIS